MTITSAIALVAAIAATLFMVYAIYTIASDEWESTADMITEVFAAIFIFGVAYGIANYLLLIASGIASTQHDRTATFLEAQEASGFQSEYEYPLVLGDRSSISYSSEEITSGLFYFNVTSQTVSGSSLLVGYEHADGTREIIEVPISAINFQIAATEGDSSLSIDLGAIDAPADGYLMERACNTKVVWGWWVVSCSEPNTLTTPGDEGVSGLLQRAFSAGSSKIVTLTVTEEQYSQILGASEDS